jgi:hypothetical protein
MKALFISLLFLLLLDKSEAQLFKKLGEKVKRDAEWRIRYKADQQVNKGIDSVIAIPKKINDKKKSETPPTGQTGSPAPNTSQSANTQNQINNTAPKNQSQKPSGNLNTESDTDDGTPKDGFITLKLSADKVFPSQSLGITGESVLYKNFRQVQVAVTGPSTNDVRQVSLNPDGKFISDWAPSSDWDASGRTGEFTVTVTSSDKKAKQSTTFTVESFDLPDYDEWPKENISETKKALEKLEAAVDIAENGISPKDKEELEKKMDELKEKVDDVLLLFKDLGKANKEMMQLARKEKRLPPNFSGYLAELNSTLADQASQMKKINEAVHKPQDNTICEHLVMVNEACAALSTFTAPVARVIKTALASIMSYATGSKPIDKENTPDKYYTFFPAKIYSIYSTAKKDADGISTKLTKVGFTADLAQFAGDVLLKKYCGIFKGEIKHDYVIDSRNNDGITWLKYGVVMQGALSLRYPKEGSKGKIIKMKGNIEGNAIKFTFYQNVEAEDGFYEGSHGKIEVVELRVIKPAAFPFVSSLNDPGGFGAVARCIATPASFYIPIDAEYDVDANKIKIFLNTPLIDFSPSVQNQLIFLLIGADLSFYFKRMSFPVAKAATTLGSVIRSNNEFDVKKDVKGNLSFFSKANKHIGDKTSVREYDLNFTITAKKE